MSDFTARRDAIVNDHHGAVQELLEKLRGHNTALESASAATAALQAEKEHLAQEHDKLLSYVEEMTRYVRNELAALAK